MALELLLRIKDGCNNPENNDYCRNNFHYDINRRFLTTRFPQDKDGNYSYTEEGYEVSL
jgi:hypothetical protein